MRTLQELRQMQSLPLEDKEIMSMQRIMAWLREYGDEAKISVSGKDSTVLAHLVHRVDESVECVFSNTGLEYPEIQSFWRNNDKCTIVRPKMSFPEVIKAYGYPFISKEVSQCVYYTRKFCDTHNLWDENHKVSKDTVIDKINQLDADGNRPQNNIISLTGQRNARAKKLIGDLLTTDNSEKSRYNNDKWFDLLNLDFEIGHYCCQQMKKKPLRQISNHAFVGTRAEESDLRTQAWLKTGCNAFNDKHGLSQPLSFWTEQDVLHYIKKYNLSVPSVYGELKYKGNDGYLYDFTLDGQGDLQFTGCQRTGCIFCGFGSHHDERFVMLKETHPKQYDYCMGGGAYDENGIWKPNEKGLGMAHCIEELNKLYSKKGKPFIKI